VKLEVRDEADAKADCGSINTIVCSIPASNCFSCTLLV
jgi:hypothetical protein